jgi:hypothetical protein
VILFPGTTNGGLFAIFSNNAIYDFVWNIASNTITLGNTSFTGQSPLSTISYNQDGTKLFVGGYSYIYLLSTGNPAYCSAVDGSGTCTQCVGT